MIESLKKNSRGIILMLISALSLSVGQLLWKFALNGQTIGDAMKTPESMLHLAIGVLPGFIVYAIGAVVMTIALGYGELSILQPINSMSYVFALILSALFLTDPISPVTVIGVIVIVAGVILIGGSSGS